MQKLGGLATKKYGATYNVCETFFYNQNLGYQIMRMMILRKDRKKYGVMKESVEKTIYFKGG